MKLWLNVLLVLCVLAAGASLWVAGGRALPQPLRRSPPPVALPLPTLDQPARLAILNGTRVDGLASTFSLSLPQIGCVAARVGNAPHRNYTRTLLINRKLDDATAAAIAQKLGGLPVLKETDVRTTEDAVLVVGGDYQVVLESIER